MCALFGKRAPQGTVAGKGEYRAPACSWPTVREHLRSVCWPNSHAPTADLWLANGNEVPTKIISPSRARDTPRNLIRSKRKEMKEVSAHWCQTCRAGSEGAHCCRETGGQLTLQAPSHTSTRKSKSMQIKSHIFLFIFCLIIITHGCSTVDTFGTVMAFCGTR